MQRPKRSTKKHSALFKSQLGSQLLLRVMLCYLVVAITSTLLQLYYEYQYEKEKLQEELVQLGSLFKPSLSQAIWDLSDEQIESGVDGLFLNPYIIGATLKDDKGQTIYSVGSTTLQQVFDQYESQDQHSLEQQEAIKQHSLENTHFFDVELFDVRNIKSFTDLYSIDLLIPEYDNGEPIDKLIGQLTLYTSSLIVIERTAFTLTSMVHYAILQTLFLFFIASWIFNRMISSPIEKLTDFMNFIDHNVEEDKPLPEKPSIDESTLKQDNELKRMFDSFHLLLTTLGRRDQTIREHKENLEQTVAERTSELVKASEVKSQFLATISHEIRTPLNGIIGMTELLRSTELTSDQQKYFDTIENSGQLLVHIINSVLDYSKIEAKKIEIETIAFDLEKILTSIKNIFQPQADKKGIALSIQAPTDLPNHLLGDPVRIQQILLNLIGNALKFTEQGEVVVDISMKEASAIQKDSVLKNESPGITLHFTISDTGIGMSPEKLSNLFKPFTQADASITRKYGGSGLGLVISKELVELMKGELIVESALDVGTSFSFALTFETAQNGAEHMVTAGVTAESTQPPPPTISSTDENTQSETPASVTTEPLPLSMGMT